MCQERRASWGMSLLPVRGRPHALRSEAVQPEVVKSRGDAVCVGRAGAGERWVQRGTWVRWRRASDAVEPVGISRHTSARRVSPFLRPAGCLFRFRTQGRSQRPSAGAVLISWTQPLRRPPVAPPLGQNPPLTHGDHGKPQPPGQSLPSHVLPIVCQTTEPTFMRTRVGLPTTKRFLCHSTARVFSTDFARDRWRPPLLRRIRHLRRLRFNAL